MSFNVNDFRQQIVGDGARPNLFEVRMNFPSFAAQGDVNRKISFFCNAAQLPGSTIGLTPAFYFGREVKLAGNRTFQEWNISIMNDEDFVVRNGFERWMNGMSDPVFNVRAASAAVVDGGYGVNATVIQYGKKGDVIKTYDFVGMFPIDIQPIDLSWSQNDTIEEFQVTLAVQYWTSQQNTSALGGVVRGLLG